MAPRLLTFLSLVAAYGAIISLVHLWPDMVRDHLWSELVGAQSVQLCMHYAGCPYAVVWHFNVNFRQYIIHFLQGTVREFFFHSKMVSIIKECLLVRVYHPLRSFLAYEYSLAKCGFLDLLFL